MRQVVLALAAVSAVVVVSDIVRAEPAAAQAAMAVPARPTVEAPPLGRAPYWQAHHETGNLQEYSWWQAAGAPTGELRVVPDPTGSGRGFVLRGEITAPGPFGGESHRFYPCLLLPECYRGGYRSSFLLWADLPPAAERGWFSFATYSSKKEWKDLFGVNLGFEQGVDCLVLFHVPSFGKGAFTRVSRIPFPMRRWVKVEVRVDDGGILLFQDDLLIAEAKKDWGGEGAGLCEAHWGLYGEGRNLRGTVLNDEVTVNLDTTFGKPPRIALERGRGKP